MGLQIVNPGILTTVQDAGRFGHQAAGFSVSGPMDADALYTANILVNNPPELACLEMTFLGVTAVFDRRTWFAVTGADMGPKLNGRPIEAYRAQEARPGDRLELGPAVNRKYTYLAVAGGIDVPVVMGSRSTNLKCGIGGFCGRKLAPGDDLPLCVTGKFLDNHYKKHLPAPLVRNHTEKQAGQSEIIPKSDGTVRNHTNSGAVVLRAVPGPQAHFFTDRGLQDFTSQTFILSPESPSKRNGGWISFPTPSPRAASRSPRRGRPSSCSPTGRPPGGTQRSPRWFPPTCPGWRNACREMGCGFGSSLWRKRTRCFGGIKNT